MRLNNKLRLAGWLLTLGSGCAAPQPDRALFVGKLQSETLSLAAAGQPCRLQDARSPPPPPGMERVCVSNACGWSDARLRVIERIAGSVPASVVRLRSVLGEWCRPCQEGTELTYCKGVYITDLRTAMSQGMPGR